MRKRVAYCKWLFFRYLFGDNCAFCYICTNFLYEHEIQNCKIYFHRYTLSAFIPYAERTKKNEKQTNSSYSEQQL